MIPTGILPILDVGTTITPQDLLPMLRAVLRGGARWVQLRAKSATDRQLLEYAKIVRAETSAGRALFFLNDRADIALLAEADGVHLGQADLPPRAVRRWYPKAIGLSCHNDEQVAAAVRDGVATYLGFGPVFATTSKVNPDPVVGVAGLARAAALAGDLPIVAIGGIETRHLSSVHATRAAGAAVISSLFRDGDPETVEARMRALCAAWKGPGGDSAPTST